MASEIQVGRAVVWGIQNDGTRIAIDGVANLSTLNILETAKLTDNFRIVDLTDEADFDVSSIATNQHFEMDLAFIPADTTIAAAAAGAVTIDPLTPITMSHFKVTAFNGKWQYRGGSTIDLSHQAGKQNLGKIRRYADDTQNDSLTTIAT